ncbi:uncharacterized protein LOC111360276 [Spodoptera litura]|uniref:Uncharacterized protein LOC111360276 n=1 Tax=Spodoptera litura TaxID=69820 RepID=A0A9J7EP75_SPOLT|nr:uncharacterized protein LOC111360276 [Spodoptera litura]
MNYFKMPRRCALGCAPSDVPMHRFPDAMKFPERLKAWVNLVGGKLQTSSDFEYYKKKRICDIHFCDSHRNRNKRLSALAIPTLHLPGQSQSPVILEQALIPTTSQPIIEQQNISEPSTSQSVVDKELTSSQYQPKSGSPPVIAGTSLQRNSASNWLLEHNYSVLSKPRRTVGKGIVQLLFKIFFVL